MIANTSECLLHYSVISSVRASICLSKCFTCSIHVETQPGRFVAWSGLFFISYVIISYLYLSTTWTKKTNIYYFTLNDFILPLSNWSYPTTIWVILHLLRILPGNPLSRWPKTWKILTVFLPLHVMKSWGDRIWAMRRIRLWGTWTKVQKVVRYDSINE